MKHKLVFATHNPHKLREVAELLNRHYNVVGLNDVGCLEDIPETATTLEGNALLKSTYVNEKYALDCFSDDTGLEVDALNNAPGVYSARYAGGGKSDKDNVLKLLQELQGVRNRKARFRTVISLLLKGESYLFEGIVTGTIAEEPKGTTGFGYDPIFIPDGYENTFAELGDEIKNKISHRAVAIQKLYTFLQKVNQ